MSKPFETQENIGICILVISLTIGVASIITTLFAIDDIIFRIIYGVFNICYIVHAILIMTIHSHLNLKISQLASIIGIISGIIIVSCSIHGYILLYNDFVSHNIPIIIGCFIDPFISFYYNIFIIYPSSKAYNAVTGALTLNNFFTICGILFSFYANRNNIYRFDPILRSRIGRVVNDSEESAINEFETPNSSLTSGIKNIHPKVHLDDSFIDHSKPLTCPVCNYKNPSESKLCISCYSKFLKCSICEKQISKEDLVFCPYCSAPYHEREFLEWLKVKAHCKNCKNDLDLWDFQIYLEEREKDYELHSKMCIKCKKHIPMDANFCIYCGLKIFD
ncbi:MAG: zinc ribbon domain-containing protein [Candidatus Hodarchaeota archaeon]